jgi:hypothetical protein
VSSRPSTAAQILTAVLSLAAIAIAGCAGSKTEQIRQGIEDVDQYSKEIEKAAEP